MNQTPADAIRVKNITFPPMTNGDMVKTEIPERRLFTKSPANRRRNLITTNLVIALGSRVARAGCEIYASSMKVQMSNKAVCSPDVLVVCGDPAFADKAYEILQNPTVAVEIFSDHDPESDRTQKLNGFLALPSIKECLLVNENEMRVEHYARQSVKQWVYRIYNERDDVIALDALGCKVNLSEVYSNVRFGNAHVSSKAVN